MRLGAVMSREQAQVYLRPIPCIGQPEVAPECATSCCEMVCIKVFLHDIGAIVLLLTNSPRSQGDWWAAGILTERL